MKQAGLRDGAPNDMCPAPPKVITASRLRPTGWPRSVSHTNPNQIWVSHLTYEATREGGLYAIKLGTKEEHWR
jgi:phosphopantothenoylcysteine synthetase/decarboxylase